MIFRCSMCHENYDEVKDHPSFETMPVAKGMCVQCAKKEGFDDPRRPDES